MMRKISFFALLALLVLSWGGYLLRKDIFGASQNYYVLESWTDTTSSVRSKGQIVLLEEAPLLRKNRRKHIEEVFWSSITLDSLSHYHHYLVTYYQESKYLTKDFKQGGQYSPIYSYWDNTMDWRNHIEDRISEILLFTRGDGSVYYCVNMYESHFNTPLWTLRDERYCSIQEAYSSKQKEFGIAN